MASTVKMTSSEVRRAPSCHKTFSLSLTTQVLPSPLFMLSATWVRSEKISRPRLWSTSDAGKTGLIEIGCPTTPSRNSPPFVGTSSVFAPTKITALAVPERRKSTTEAIKNILSFLERTRRSFFTNITYLRFYLKNRFKIESPAKTATKTMVAMKINFSSPLRFW